MITLEYKILIHASPEIIWKCLWDEENYRKWTEIFTEGSHYVTESFTEGSPIHLLDKNGSGMYSIIHQMKPNQYLAFRHIGIVTQNQEQTIDEETALWTGSLETYELIPEQDGKTTLIAKVETFETYQESMERSFPGALDAVKIMAESC